MFGQCAYELTQPHKPLRPDAEFGIHVPKFARVYEGRTPGVSKKFRTLESDPRIIAAC